MRNRDKLLLQLLILFLSLVMQDLASTNGYYRIRLQPKSAESSDDLDNSVTTFVKAVSLNLGTSA